MFTTLKSVVAATVIAAMALAASCSYDDSGINQRVDRVEKDLAALTERVAALEKKLDEQVEALTKLINGKTVVTKVEKAEDGSTKVTLSDGSSFTVYPKAEESGNTTVAATDTTIAPYKAEDGVYYWAIFDGGKFQKYLEVDGQKVPVFAEVPEAGDSCDCEGVSCSCELKFDVDDTTGKLLVSIDGGQTWVDSGLSAQQVESAGVFTEVVVNDNNTVTFTLADGEKFTVALAEVVEFEAAKSAIYVKAGETLSIAFAINDAVEDINVMNTPLGWKASVEAPTRAVGGMDYVLNITGPAKNFLQYAEKSGKIAIHFNTAAGACKVMNIDVELAGIDLQVDKAGNVTINNTWVDSYERAEWGVVEQVVEFNNFYFAVVNLADYNECEGDLESVYNSNWGEFNIPAVASYAYNFFMNVGENDSDSAIYVDGVNEKWTINFTVEEVIDYLNWYGQLTYEGNSFMVCVIPTDVHNQGSLMWDEMVAVPFKQLALSIVENVDARTFNNVYFDVTLRGAVKYHLYPQAKADIDYYIEEGWYESMEEYFLSAWDNYLLYPQYSQFGMAIESDVVEPNISFAELMAYTSGYSYFELAPNTEYVMCLFAEEEGKTEYTKEDMHFIYFSTADITPAETPMEISYVLAENHGLYTVAVDLTVPETVVVAYTRWYDNNEMEADALKADLIANGYDRDAAELADNNYTFYAGTDVEEPGTVKYLGVLVIDAAGNYTLELKEFKSNDLVINETYVPTIESVTFDAEGAHITVGGLEGADVKAYQYYIISTTGGSYYQRTEAELYDVAYSSSWLYQSSETNPILATRTADYSYSFSDGTYKVAVGVQFADGTYSNCVYDEIVYEQVAEELKSVTAAYQESNPNYYALTLTTADDDVITTTAGNGGVNYLNEGTWDFQFYYDSGYALGNTYMNGTQWVSDIKITVAYVEGKYDLTVNSSVGKFHYYGDIEGLIVPGYESEEPAEPALVEFTSVAVAAADSNLNYHNLTFTDGTYTAVIKLATRGTAEYVAGLYDQNGSFGDASTLYIGGYATDNTWNGAECWPVTMEVIDNGDGTATFNLDYTEYPSAVEHHGTYTGVLEGLTLVEREEPEQPSGVITVEIINATVGYDEPGEKEMQFWHSATNAHVIDFKGMDNCVPGQPLVAGYYSSAEYTIDEDYSIFDYGTTNGVMSSVECTVTDNGNGSLTYDAKFVYNGQQYAFVYTSPEVVE